jgi:hypothetical protein
MAEQADEMTSATACAVALPYRAPLSVTAMAVTNIATKCWHWRFNCAAAGSISQAVGFAIVGLLILATRAQA